MKKALYIFVILSFLILSACKKPVDKARVEIIDGIEYIHNTETPMYPDKTVTFVEDLSIGGEDEKGNIILFRPQRFIVNQNENIYISDDHDLVIKVFDPNGKYLRAIGRKGEGPGEFKSIQSHAFLPDGRLLVMDYSAHRSSFFDPSGNLIESYQWKKRLSQLHFVTNSSYIVNEYIYVEDKSSRRRILWVKEYNFEGNEICSFGEFVQSKTKQVREGNRSVMMGVPHSPESIFAADQNRQYLYHCLNNNYIIEVYDKSGKVFRKIDRLYETLPFTSKDADKFRTPYENSRNELLKKLVKEMPMPKLKTITPYMLVDDLGNLWVETHEKKEEEDRIITLYDIFNKDGYYEAKVWLDKRPSLFVKGKMYQMETDKETGHRFMKRYRAIWSE